jgi:hypothetical protein
MIIYRFVVKSLLFTLDDNLGFVYGDGCFKGLISLNLEGFLTEVNLDFSFTVSSNLLRIVEVGSVFTFEGAEVLLSVEGVFESSTSLSGNNKGSDGEECSHLVLEI